MLGPSTRPPLPTSSSDFALPPSTSSSSSDTTYAADDLSPFMLRIRRPSLLVPRAPSLPDRPQRSPLAASVIRSSTNTSEESESDRENVKMQTDTPPSGDSGSSTPLLPGPVITSAPRDTDMKPSELRSPSTPPPNRKSSDAIVDGQASTSTFARAHGRRLSQKLKPPRIRSLIYESHPDEDEVRSEAQFQRLVASFCELPSPHRVHRPPSDRGRYPEEADVEEPQREDTPSDDEGDLDDSVPFSFVEPIPISKSVTPAPSLSREDLSMLDSPGGGMAMDVDAPSSVAGSPSASSWRHTPPPTSSAVRSNKRKLEDRYDPYPTAHKRRAVSPSISYLRDNQPSLFNPRTPSGTPRLSMPIPIPVPGPSSATSSPIVGPSSAYFGRGPTSALSSPTLRAQIGLGSPILRPIIPRPRRYGDEEREVDGAGDGVNGLSLR